MHCVAERSFVLSPNGRDTQWVRAGSRIDIPDADVAGLLSEGFVIEAKALAASPENKVIASAPENKRGVAKGPRGFWYVMDGERRISRGYPTEQAAREAAL